MYNMQISIFGYKLDLEILILIGILYLILVGHTVCGCCNMPRVKKAVEGFVGASTNNGMSMELTDYNVPVDASKWGQPSLVVKPGEKPDAAVQAILDRPEQPIPLPEGQMLMFATTPFKPECCGSGGSTFSNSMGCACMTTKQVGYLNNRGGNNVPYSQY